MRSARDPRSRSDDFLITQSGYDRLRRRLESLTTAGRREAAARLRDARRGGGDPAENGELMDALEQSAELERRIGDIQARLAVARVAAPAGADGVAAVGTRVGVRTGDGAVLHYDLVGAGEADPARGRISIASPVGEAIAGCRAGERVEVRTPRHRVDVELVSVEPLDARLSQAA